MARPVDTKLKALEAAVRAEYRKLINGSAADASEAKGAEGVNFLTYMEAVMRLDAYRKLIAVEEPSPSRSIAA
jgi:hypothetical protein